jgi:hypothetical protein
MLTNQMKQEIIAYCVQYSKGVVEDTKSCPLCANAYEQGEIDQDLMEQFIDNVREHLLEKFA